MFAPLLDTIDITGMLITADCLHTQRKHACYLHERDADFVFCVKDNQPGLFDALDVLAWRRRAGHPHRDQPRDTAVSKRRTLQVMPAPPDLPFPHVKQVFLVERAVTDLAGTPLSNVAILGVTSMNPQRGTPTLIAKPSAGNGKSRVLHWIRDTVYREDDSTVHTRSGPRVMAALRNLAIGALRLAGRPTSPRPPAGPPATWTDHSQSSDSRHDLEMAVPGPGSRMERMKARPILSAGTSAARGRTPSGGIREEQSTEAWRAGGLARSSCEPPAYRSGSGSQGAGSFRLAYAVNCKEGTA